ncbi:MAG: hypothetical protein WBP38_05905 [Hyphomicrobium sp.]|jgi:hypothetical protein
MVRAMMSAMVVLLLALPVSAVWASPAYRVVSEDGDSAALRVTVRLDARQSEADLQAIADEVRAHLPTTKVVRSVLFYLPATALTEKAWAEVRLSTPPVVTISGVRLDEEAAYRAEVASDTRPRVGVWLTSPPALTGRLTIYRDKTGQPFAEWRLRSGQMTTDALKELRTNQGRRFVIVDSDGGYYQLSSNGTLELGVEGRKIAIAEPLKIASPAVAVRSPAKAAPDTASVVQSDAQKSAAEIAKLPAKAEGAAPAHAKPAVRRNAAVRKKPAVRQADATANDAISRALAQ